MGCAASVAGGKSAANVQPLAAVHSGSGVVPSPLAKSPTKASLPAGAVPLDRSQSSKVMMAKVDTDPLVRLQAMIMEMGKRGKIELTSIVVRESSGEEPGTLTKAQIPSLRQIPGLIFSMANVTELVLRCNQIQRVPAEIGQLKALTVLDLSENQLELLPDEITELPNLKTFEVAENHLTALPATIGALVKLEILRANRNKLRDVPDSIGRCKKLKVLNVYNNHITTLGLGLAGLTELDEVTVSNNALTQMPAMSQWRKVKFLYLQSNKLTSLPSLDGLLELELLQAHQNALTELPSMENLLQLKKIDVNTNQIRDVPIAIQRMPQVVHLNFRKNRVTAVPVFLSACRTLEILDFGNNPIEPSVPAELAHLSNLKTLLLDGTKVSIVPIELLGLRKLTRAHFGNCLRMDDQETAEVCMELKVRCKDNGGWLKTGG